MAKTSGHSRRVDSPEWNPYAGKSVALTEFAAALGASSNSLDHSIDAMKDLCCKLVIRYGAGLASSELLKALGLPKSEPLLMRPLGISDERWQDLSSRVTLPQPGLLSFDVLAEVRVASDAAAELLKACISGLRAERGTYEPIPQSVGKSFFESSLGINEGLEARKRDGDNPELLAHLMRQLSLFRDLGSKWTLITPEEREFLEREAPARGPNQPDLGRLAEVGLVWKWKEERGSFEPAFRGSAYKSSTFFDFSTRYFDEILTSDTAKGWSTEKRAILEPFLRDLEAARNRYELNRSRGESTAEKGWRSEQKEALEKFLKVRDT